MNFKSTRRLLRRTLLTVCALTADASAVEKITYQDHIYPIFSATCLNCHNPDKKKGDLDLSTFSGAMTGGSGGKILTAGDGGSSKLYNCIVQTEEPFMPPEGEKLGKKETDLIRAWIDGGLLETKDSTAKKKEKPAFSLAINSDASGKPEGPPPMPQDLLLEPVVVAERPDVVADLDASPWAPLLAVTGQKQVLLYNTDSLELAAVLPFPDGMPETLSFHPSGQYLLAGGGIGGKSGTTIVWDIKTGKVILRAGKEFDSILAADLRNDLGGISFGGPSRLVKLWDTRADEQLLSIKKHTDWVTALAYSPDGVLLATGDRNNGIQIWEAATGNEFHTLREHQGAITALAWRADSNLLASASEDGQFIIWEMNNGGAVKKQAAHPGGVLSLDYARDGQLITSGRDKKVKIWKPDFNLAKELPPFSDIITEVAFSHDAKRFFTADYSGNIEVWDSASYAKIGQLASNPPSIGQRLTFISAILEKHPAAVQAAAEKLKAAELTIAQAQQQLATSEQVVKDHEIKTQQLKTRIQEATNLINQNNQTLPQLEKSYQESTVALQQSQSAQQTAQAKVNELNALKKDLEATIAKTQVQVADLQKKAVEAQQAAEVKKDDAALAEAAKAAQMQANESKIRLDSELAKLAQSQAEFASQQENLNRLTAESQQRDAAAKDFAKKIAETRAALEATQKQQQQAQQELAATEKKIPELKNAIEPARKNLEAKQGELAPVKLEHDSVVAQRDQLNAKLKHWQAAEINTQRLKTQEAVIEKSAQKESLSSEFQTLAKKLSDPKNATTPEDQSSLIDLKNNIDQLAAELGPLQKLNQDLTQQYQASKAPAKEEVTPPK